MKLLILPLAIFILILLVSCNPGTETRVREFIPGTYITEWDNGFSTARDTILVKPAPAEGGDSYSIIRRTFYRQSVNGKTLNPKYKIARWTGRFNQQDMTVVINKNGRILSFDPDKKEMRMGSAIYKKL
jgi:hypothetical protein